MLLDLDIIPVSSFKLWYCILPLVLLPNQQYEWVVIGMIWGCDIPTQSPQDHVAVCEKPCNVQKLGTTPIK